MAKKKGTKKSKVRDLKPRKDAKGGWSVGGGGGDRPQIPSGPPASAQWIHPGWGQ